jgi:hypothetical protein
MMSQEKLCPKGRIQGLYQTLGEIVVPSPYPFQTTNNSKAPILCPSSTMVSVRHTRCVSYQNKYYIK